MAPSLKVLVLFSGRGSNLNALIEGAKNGRGYEILEAITDNPNAEGVVRAREHSIPCKIFERKKESSKEEFKREIFSYVEQRSPDLIALAGFMQLVPSWFIEKWSGKIINIHPSILPAFPGLRTHDQAIAARVKEHGCSVHFVDAGVDTGPVIAQLKCQVFPDDTAEILAARVLQLEHRLYPEVVEQFALGKIAFPKK